jgi:predicted ATPase/DNA-binding SARP family transcriptional activator
MKTIAKPAALHVNLLGPLQVSICVNDAEQAIHLSAAAANLLACLAVHAPRALLRARLIGMLFPDHKPSTANKALTDALSRLRRELTDALAALSPKTAGDVKDWLGSKTGAVQLNLAHVRLDWLTFKQLAQSSQPSQLADWERALALYRGDLLEDFDAEWADQLRGPLQQQVVALLERTCTALSQTPRLTDAVALAQRWILADPLSEEAHMAAMRLYARQSRYTSALQQYDHLARVLKDEMALEPTREARLLAQKIRAEATRMTRVTRNDDEQTENPERPFIGREAEFNTLIRAIERMSTGRGELVLVEGESGMGKTRLLEEVTASARWRGWTLAWGRTQQHTGTTPCAPLDQALQAAISGPRAEHIRMVLNSAAVELLSHTVPAVRKPEPHQETYPSPLVAPLSAAPDAIVVAPSLALPTAANATPAWTLRQMDLADVIVEAMLALAQLGPQLFVLDDVQWADTNLWDALLKLAPKLAGHPILLMLSYRDNEIRQNTAAWHALQELDVQLRPKRVALSGLSVADCSTLTAMLGKPITQAEAEALHQATQGKPLFVAGVVGGVSGGANALGEKRSTAVSSASFQALFDGKLISLTPQTRNVLEAAAVLGREFTHAAWQAVAGADVGDVMDALPTLKSLDLVIESERGCRFPHDFLHEQIYAAIGPERLRDLHKRATAALHAERAEPGVLAWHAEKAGAWREAVRHHRKAGDKAEAAYAYASALEHFARGFALLDNLEPQEMKFDRLRLLCSRQLVYGMGLRLKEWQADIEEIETLAEELGATVGLMTALEARMTLALFASDMEGIRKAGDRALALAKTQGNRRAEARIANVLAMHLANRLGQAERARKLLQASVAYASSAKDPLLHVSALCNLSGAQRFCGDCNEAKDNALRALTLSQLDNQLYAARADALQALGCAEWYLARWQAAHTDLAAACQLHNNLNNIWAALDDTLNFTILNAHMGNFDAAISALQQLQTLGRSVGLSADSDLWKWSEALLADVYVLAGELDKAEQVLLGMADWMSKAIEARQLLSALQTQGRLLLERGEPRFALEPLEHAKAIWLQEQTVQVEPLLLHALAAHGAGDEVAAKASVKLAEQRLQRSDALFANVQLHWVRHVVLGDGAALSQAREEMHRQAAQFDDVALRTRFLNQIQLHRQIEAAWQAHTHLAQAADADVRHIIVRLTRADVPLGRKLTDADRVDVIWTVDAGAPDAGVFQQAGKAGLRQHRLKRLLEEARAQGAAPTDEDLAAALQVQVRTIERDMAALGKQVRGLTRRRR